jgi:hypothetical protein
MGINPREGLKEVLESNLMTNGVGLAEGLAEVGKYFGLNPALANSIYAVEALQKALAGRLNAEEALGRLAGAGINAITTSVLESWGFPAPLAAGIGDFISHYATKYITAHDGALVELVREHGGQLIGMDPAVGDPAPQFLGGKKRSRNAAV